MNVPYVPPLLFRLYGKPAGIHPPHDAEAQFVEQAHRTGHHEQGEDIRGRRNDGSHDEDEHNGMAAVAAHEGGGEQAQTGEQPREDGHLEHDAHGQTHHEQGAHVGGQGNHVHHFPADLIGSEEPEGEREKEEVGEQYARQEHRIAATDGRDGVAPLVGIERRRHEAEELVEDVGRRAQHPCTHRRLDMDEELLGQSGIDELHLEAAEGLSAPQAAQAGEKAVGDETGILGGKDNGKQVFLEQEGYQAGDDRHGNHPYQYGPQRVEMVPEALPGVSSCCHAIACLRRSVP